MGNGSKSDSRVILEKFLSIMTLVYSSTLEEKMQLVFNIFDFDFDGKISAEDVRLVLSYIPIRRDNVSTLSLEDSSQERDESLTKLSLTS